MSKRIALMTAMALHIAAPAWAAPHGVKIGVLTCNVQSGWGYIVGSSKDVSCNYHPSHGEDDAYVGHISKFGLDIGYTSGSSLVWDVIAPTSDMRRGALVGDYGGATASATVAAGLGAHVLFGGFDKSVALQPVSIESNSGLDISAGIGALSLRTAPRAPTPVAVAAPAPLNPPPQPERRETSYSLTFPFDSAALTPRARGVIRDAALEMRDDRQVRIVVTGHADRVGTLAYNDHLSLERARAVRAALVRNGVDGDMIHVAGRGFDDPAIPTGPGVRERRNRQVVIVIRTDGAQRQALR